MAALTLSPEYVKMNGFHSWLIRLYFWRDDSDFFSHLHYVYSFSSVFIL